MEKEKKIIEKISDKTKGVLVDGKWYSTSDRVKPYVKKELEGSEVELTTTPGEKGEIVTFMKPTGTTQQTQPQGQKQYGRDDSRIMRHGLINSAIEFYKMRGESVSAGQVVHTAEAFKEYVENGQIPETTEKTINKETGKIEEEDVE